MTWVLGATGWILRTIFKTVFEVDFCIVNGSLASWHRAVQDMSDDAGSRGLAPSHLSLLSLLSHVVASCPWPGLQSISLHESHCAPHDHWALLSGPPPAECFRANLIWQGDNVTVSQWRKDRTPGFRNVAKTWVCRWFWNPLHRSCLVGFVCLSLHLISHMVFCLHLSLSISLGYERWFTVEIRPHPKQLLDSVA